MALHQQIKYVQFELTSRCNAQCPGCSRVLESAAPNPYYTKNYDLPLDVFEKILRDPAMSHVDNLFLCGNYGDPAAYTHLLPAVQLMNELFPNAGLSLHSNGGIRNEEFWSELGRLLSGKYRKVKFAIDGLEDTNHLYRRGVQWSAIEKNVKAFVQGGGRAVWKWIQFPHNEHQLTRAKELAKEWGFRDFEVRPNSLPQMYEGWMNQDYRNPGAPWLPEFQLSELIQFNEAETASSRGASISCKSQEQKALFIDAYGKVWPCCWLANDAQTRWHEVREHFQKRVLSAYPSDFNSLVHHSLTEVMNQPWYQSELQESWSRSPTAERNPLHSTCARICANPCLSLDSK